MKYCSNCGTQLDDNAAFCANCGTAFGATAPADPFDHTAEFEAADVSENKPFAMLMYLMGILGIVIALLASRDSQYLKFHTRQIIKIQVITLLSGVAMALLFWTIIVPIAGAIWLTILFVVQIICFFKICAGKSIEPPIVRSIGFLK